MDGFLDKAKAKLDEVMDNTTLDEKARDAYAEHGDKVAPHLEKYEGQIDQGIDRTSDFVDERTGGRFTEQIEQGEGRLREGLDSLDGDRGDFGTAADPAVDPVDPTTDQV